MARKMRFVNNKNLCSTESLQYCAAFLQQIFKRWRTSLNIESSIFIEVNFSLCSL